MAMRFEHEFSIPVPVERAWAVLLDVGRVAPCLPGASLDAGEEAVEGAEFTGGMRVKVGPITVVYRGVAVFEEIDKDAYRLRLRASGKESRGPGTAEATVAARLLPDGDRTTVGIETTFHVTGRPAQFGRGVMREVGERLIDRFAENLAAQLTADALPAREREQEQEERHLASVPRPDEPGGTQRTSRTPDEEALDLLEAAGRPLLRRLAPVAGTVALFLVIIWLIRRIFR